MRYHNTQRRMPASDVVPGMKLSLDIVAETPVPEQAPDPNKGQITEDGYKIEVDGHIGTWYVIDTEVIDSTKYFLLEHEEHGDEAACVIVDGDGKLALDDVWNGFDDLRYHFDSLEPVADTEKASFVEPAPLVPDNFVTGEKIDTPRGSFRLTTMTKEQMEQAGYGYHHSSDDGVFHIMSNGTRAFAIRNEDS